jgi:hypothetical protein
MNPVIKVRSAGRVAALAAGVSFAVAASTAAWVANAAPARESADGAPPPTVTRRLTPEQYQIVIEDVFGPTIKVRGRLDPTLRVDGLHEVGAAHISVSPSSMEQYDSIARSIAEQALLDPQYRAILMPCQPKSPEAADSACAGQFISKIGSALFRRPIKREELELHVGVADKAAAALNDFYRGLSLSLSGLLVSPQFLFRQETVVPDRAQRGAFKLDATSKASRLSFFLWNSAPDQQLMAAAEKGDLDTRRGLARQVDRMISSPRLAQGVRAFFADMLHLGDIAALSKDQAIYPKFSAKVSSDAGEQTLRTIADVLVAQRADYREIFTTRKTFLTKNLAAVYRVPLAADVPNGSPDPWQPYEFPSQSPYAGILTHLSFLALHSHPGRSSPTLRGKAVREVLMCQTVPSPPGDVDFTLVQDTGNTRYRTARERLTAHSNEPVCAGCHKIMDPLGLALENFDGGGGHRAGENGAAIDASGAIDGIAFDGGASLGQALHKSAAATSCLVDRLTSYSLGRPPAVSERPWIAELKTEFAEDGFVVPELMRQIALSDEFYRASPPAGGAHQ